MALWGKTSNAESRPKSLPMDSNSSYSREFATANSKGWIFQPGVASAATGNDNASADPEILVAIRNLSSLGLKTANLLSIDYTAKAYADAALFDLVLTFDENITVTSAAATEDQVITNKAYIILNRIGATDMVVDNTFKCQYFAGTGTNTITFRGELQTAAAGFVGFADAFIHTDGTATVIDGDGEGFSGIQDEQSQDSIIADANGASASGVVNGAITASKTVVVDGVGGTIAVGQVVTVSGAGGSPAASITATSRNPNVTTVSTNNELTITAVASQTSFTVSEDITVANDINLLFSLGAGDKNVVEVIDMSDTGGATGLTSVVGTQAYRTGFGVDTQIGRVMMLEEDDSSKIISETDGIDGFGAEEFTTDAAGLVIESSKLGSTSGSADILNGVTTT